MEIVLQNSSGNLTFSNGANSPGPLQVTSVIIFVLFTVSSLFCYFIVLVILIAYFKEFKSNFYYAVISLAIVDVTFLLLILVHSVPCTVQQRDIWSGTPHLAGIIEAFCYFSQCNHLTYIAVNHFCRASTSLTAHPLLAKVLDGRVALYIWIGFLWLAATPNVITAYVAGCKEYYDYRDMAFLMTCEDWISPEFTERVRLANNIVSGFLPSLVALLHALAWLVIRIKGRRHKTNVSQEIMQQRKREVRILVQFTLISLALFLSYGTFWAIPAWFGNDSPALVIITFSSIFSSGINPFIYLAFNKLMKAKAKYLIYTFVLRRTAVVEPAS